ncbi:hypothetical protein QE152_g38996 [Popillia japonica]|uniref:Uncharacterized protein n=1 Tax=Popillia japonica TaxID=7064 RepID=A0AAW1HVV0_POPJA
MREDLEDFKEKTQIELEKNIEAKFQDQTSIWKRELDTRLNDEVEEFQREASTEVKKVQKELVETKREVEQRIKGIENATPISVEKMPIYDASNKGIQPQETFEALERHFKMSEAGILAFEALERHFKMSEAGILVKYSSVYHSQPNLVEKVMRELGKCFRMCCIGKHTS